MCEGVRGVEVSGDVVTGLEGCTGQRQRPTAGWGGGGVEGGCQVMW